VINDRRIIIILFDFLKRYSKADFSKFLMLRLIGKDENIILYEISGKFYKSSVFDFLIASPSILNDSEKVIGSMMMYLFLFSMV